MMSNVQHSDIDIDRIKAEVSIADLVAQEFTVIKTGNSFRTKEHDSLTIFPNTNTWKWFSQAGDGGHTLGGTDIDWYMHANKVDVGVAIKELWQDLTGEAGHRKPRKPVMPVTPAHSRKDTSQLWKHEQWQRAANHRIEAAIDRLHNTSDGAQGREELLKRGISLDTALAYDMGFAMAFNKGAEKMLPAILLPWKREKVTYVTARFIGVNKDDKGNKDDKKPDRYLPAFGVKIGHSNHYGSRYLFGLQHCNGHGKTLVLTEGEMNAISVAQEAWGVYPCDVASFGSQDNLKTVARMAVKIASGYDNVIVWADKKNIAEKSASLIPGAVPVASPRGLDANDMLRQGILGDFLFQLLSKVCV